MDYRMMRHINDIQIQKEVDARIARDAIRQKKTTRFQRQTRRSHHDHRHDHRHVGRWVPWWVEKEVMAYVYGKGKAGTA